MSPHADDNLRPWPRFWEPPESILCAKFGHHVFHLRAPNVIYTLGQLATKLGPDWKVVVMVGKLKWLITEQAIVSEAGHASSFVATAEQV